MLDASDTLDMSMVGHTYALTPVLSTELLVGDIVLAAIGSRLLSPMRVTQKHVDMLKKLEVHLVMKLGRV